MSSLYFKPSLLPILIQYSSAPRREYNFSFTSRSLRAFFYHRYNINAAGLIQDAKIVPPTSQNQKTIERNLWHFVSQTLHLPDEELTWKCEQAIRNYDPCISCSTHGVQAYIERE